MIILEKLGENIRFCREQLDWTQQELAGKINISRSVLTKWENGNLVPDIQSLLTLSRIFNVSLDGLVGRNYKSNLILQEVKRMYNFDNDFLDEQMIEIIRYLKNNEEIKQGLFELSCMTKKNRRPIQEIMKVTFREILSK